ncbi:MAG TPA: hypothetical protein VGM88_08035 [Kofleriaceae bacterium]|jgi:hypothetical protein
MWWRRFRYVLALAGLCAIATCPAAKRGCTRKVQAREADELLGYLADRVAARVAATGKVPPTAAPLTPEPACCEQGGTCAPDPATWAADGWRDLAFTIDGPYRYSYEYAPDPSGLSATLRAVGDLACDGTTSRVEVVLTVDDGQVSRVWHREGPPE